MKRWPASSSPPQNRSPSPRRRASSQTIQMSERASPRGATTAGPELDVLLAVLRRPEAHAQALALPRGGHRQHHVRQRRGGRQEEIGVDQEVEAGERGARGGRAGRGEQQVGAEADHAAHRVGRAVEHGAIGVGRGGPALARGPERPPGQAERLRALALREQRERGQVVDRRAARPHVAARRVEAAGERVEQRERAHGLARVGVLLEPGPVEVGDRAALPEQPRGLDDLGGRDAGDGLHPLGRVLAAERGVGLERRHARDGAGARHAPHGPVELRDRRSAR